MGVLLVALASMLRAVGALGASNEGREKAEVRGAAEERNATKGVVDFMSAAKVDRCGKVEGRDSRRWNARGRVIWLASGGGRCHGSRTRRNRYKEWRELVRSNIETRTGMKEGGRSV